MSALAIIIIAIAASDVLMMRFRKRWLAKTNIAFTNRIYRAVRRLASGLPHPDLRRTVGSSFIHTPKHRFKQSLDGQTSFEKLNHLLEAANTPHAMFGLRNEAV